MLSQAPSEAKTAVTCTGKADSYLTQKNKTKHPGKSFLGVSELLD